MALPFLQQIFFKVGVKNKILGVKKRKIIRVKKFE